MRRGEIYWALLPPPVGRRPVVILTRDPAVHLLSAVVAAPITTTVRGIASEVPVGPEDGLSHSSVITCDNLLTAPRVALDPEPVGELGRAKIRQLDSALRYALGIRY